jgi:hypothetical protein
MGRKVLELPGTVLVNKQQLHFLLNLSGIKGIAGIYVPAFQTDLEPANTLRRAAVGE